MRFRVDDAGRGDEGRYDLVTCIGATWIGDGLAGTLDLMRKSLIPGGRVAVGEPFLEGEPTALGRESHPGMSDLGGILDRIEAAGFELIEMVIASREDWDRYAARHWATAAAWLSANPAHADAGEVQEWTDRFRRTYVADERAWLGWGVFVLADRRSSASS